jgi:hypothetical protein
MRALVSLSVAAVLLSLSLAAQSRSTRPDFSA